MYAACNRLYGPPNDVIDGFSSPPSVTVRAPKVWKVSLTIRLLVLVVAVTKMLWKSLGRCCAAGIPYAVKLDPAFPEVKESKAAVPVQEAPV